MDNQPLEALMIKEFFPSTREEFRKHYPETKGKKMTREEHIKHLRAKGWVFVGHSLTDEEVFQGRPWLASDEEFAKWERLEAYDRFVIMVCGLPWTDEVISLVKQNNGPQV